MKKIDTIEAFHANEDGTTCQKVLNLVYVAEQKRFQIALPNYVAGHAAIDKVVGESVGAVVGAYETRCDEYSRWKLSFKTEPKIALKVLSPAASIGPFVGLNMLPVSVTTTGDVYARNEDGTLGVKFHEIDWTYLLDDMPEVRAKAQRLMDSIEAARSLLLEMANWDDPQAYFLSIPENQGSKPAEPVQSELPLDEPAAPAPAVADEDDDL